MRRALLISIVSLVIGTWVALAYLLAVPSTLARKFIKKPKVTALLAVVLGLALVAGMGTPDPIAAAPLFRVIDVRAEYGHLIVEAQHYNPDGSHWFYENYTFQGREQFSRPKVTDQLGNSPITRLFLKSTGMVAPTRQNSDGKTVHYLPAGEEWLRYSRPHLGQGSILSVIQSIHGQRQITGWARGKERLTTHALDYKAADIAGAGALSQRFSLLTQAAFRSDSNGALVAYTRPLPAIDPYVSSSWGTVSTFFSDADPESTSVDGTTEYADATGQTWTIIRDGDPGTGADDGVIDGGTRVRAHTSTDEWQSIKRYVALYDTSSIGDTDTIDSATLDFVTVFKREDFTDSLSLVTTTPATDTALVLEDHDQYGTTKQASDLTITGLVVDTSDPYTFSQFVLNSTGLGNISLTGITKFGIRQTSDNDDVEPTWVSAIITQVELASADHERVGDPRHRLVVTHTTPPTAAITGTIGDGATESEVRDGAGTIIITLTDATWVAAGGAFDAQRQNIIDGLDAAESETNGWNAQVRDQIAVGSVVRTSSTIATITLTASEVANYRVDSNETVTVTVPASAHSGSSAITATPTIAITAVAESVAITGTLGGSGGTPAEIVAGGETIILTGTNVVWVDSGATFNAQRQNIIDGLDSNLSDQNGWDNRRSDFAVGDVVRTSGTVVTITLSASSAYAIPATETITATVPASAVVFGAALVGTPTFTITPSFVASGNRVTPAINLSGVTDVAFCSLAWQAVVPIGTTLTVDTSVNGGTSYTAGHTNGNCPSGITIGGTLAAITDFRIRVNLATTDSTVTPIMQTLALVIEDTSGQELYYQLNTTPSATITDRSSTGVHTGTMSFPVGTSALTASTGIQRSTESGLTVAQARAAPQVASEVTGSATPDNLFNLTETGFTTLPGQGLIEAISTAGENDGGGLPLRFVWFIFLGFIVIGIGVLAMQATGNLFLAGIVMAAGLGFSMSIGSGLMPGWILFTYVPIAGALIMFKKGFNP